MHLGDAAVHHIAFGSFQKLPLGPTVGLGLAKVMRSSDTDQSQGAVGLELSELLIPTRAKSFSVL